MWPRTLDLTVDECRVLMRKLELEAYTAVISAFRAQGVLTQAKLNALLDLRKILNVGQDRHRAEIRRATNDEHLTTIAERLSGDDCVIPWTREGKRGAPLLCRSQPYTTLTITANEAAAWLRRINRNLPEPNAVKRTQSTDAQEEFPHWHARQKVVLEDPIKAQAGHKLLSIAAELKGPKVKPPPTPVPAKSAPALPPPPPPPLPEKRIVKPTSKSRAMLPPATVARKHAGRGVKEKEKGSNVPFRIDFLHPALADPLAPGAKGPVKRGHPNSRKGTSPSSAAKAKRRSGNENSSALQRQAAAHRSPPAKVQILDKAVKAPSTHATSAPASSSSVTSAPPSTFFENGSILFNHLQRKITPKPLPPPPPPIKPLQSNQRHHHQHQLSTNGGTATTTAVVYANEGEAHSEAVEYVMEDVEEVVVMDEDGLILEDSGSANSSASYLNYSAEIIEETPLEEEDEDVADVCEDAVEFVAEEEEHEEGHPGQNGTDYEYLLDADEMEGYALVHGQPMVAHRLQH